MKTIKALVVLSVIMAGITLSFRTVEQNADWKVPAEEAAKENPVEVDDEILAIGKSLYSKHCKSCHGSEGLGDGTKAEELDAFPGDFTSSEFTSQSDGALMYKLTAGRDEMPEFSKKIPEEEDRWILVHYMRKLAE